MTGISAPGLCLKMPDATGNTNEKRLTCSSITPKETLTGILVEIDSDTCHILREN